MEGPFPAQGCVLGGLERPFWPSSWDSAHEGTPARETEPAPVTPKRQVPWPAPFPGPAPPAGDSGCSRERRRAPSLAPWGSFFLCVIFGARRLQSLLLAPSFLDPRGAQGRAGSPFAPLALAPRGLGGWVLVSVSPGGICGTSPAGKLLLLRLRSRRAGSPECGLHTPRALCGVHVHLGQQRDAPGALSGGCLAGGGVSGNGFFQRRLSPTVPPGTRRPPASPAPKQQRSVASLPFRFKPRTSAQTHS